MKMALADQAPRIKSEAQSYRQKHPGFVSRSRRLLTQAQQELKDEHGPGLVLSALDKAMVDKLLRTQPRKPLRSGYSLFTGEIIAMSNSRSSKEGMRKASHNEAMIASCLVPLSPCVS